MHGRLGNQLFQYATARALQEKTKQPLLFSFRTVFNEQDKEGNIGWEDYQREWINSNPALYYNLSGIGRVGYKGNGKKNGGKLKKNRRTTYA